MTETTFRRRAWQIGLAVVGGVCLAILLLRSKQPAATAETPQTLAGVGIAAAQEAAGELPPGVGDALDRLRRRLEAQPEDLAARKELAVRLVEHGRMMEAFEEAQRVLAQAPDDPDGLYVEGEVRVAMGQWDRAVDRLDRVLARHPDHLLALIARGRAHAGAGRVDAALADWRHGLRVVGGHYPPIERLIASFRDGGRQSETAPPPAGRPSAPLPIELIPAQAPGAGAAPTAPGHGSR